MQWWKVLTSTLRQTCVWACYLHACTLHWGSASVNCVPTGTEPLAVGWRSRAHSATTTCLVPGRVTRLLQGGPPQWAGVAVCECVRCVCIICEIGGRLQPERRGNQGEQGASRSMGLSDFCHRKGSCCRDSQTGVALVWVLLPPRANGNPHVLPSVHLSVCLSICILN